MKISQALIILSGILLASFLACKSEVREKTTEKIPEATQNATEQKAQPVILFFGNSLTAAYGLDAEEGFTALIQDKIDDQDLNYKVVNAGLSGETSAGGLNRIDWILERQKVAIFVLELGGNDGLRGLNPKGTYENLKSIAEKVRKKYPDCKLILAGMQAPPNMGQTYTTEFREIFPRLAKEQNLALIPFLLEGVAGDKALNQSDGIHPTAAGQIILAENIWKILGPKL